MVRLLRKHSTAYDLKFQIQLHLTDAEQDVFLGEKNRIERSKSIEFNPSQ